jgi:GNAT superfamily N-acetyltransferase
MATQFQQLRPADALVLAAHLVAWRREDGIRLDPAAAEHEARRLLGNDQAWHAWLVRHGDRVVGYLVVQFASGSLFEVPRGQLGALYIAAAARGQGLGRKAQRFLQDLGRWLHVRVQPVDPADEAHHLGAIAGARGARFESPDPFLRQALA